MTLVLDGVHSSYGEVPILRGVSLTVAAGEVVALLGRNGSGKTTTLKAILGLVAVRAGRVTLDGEDLTRIPAHEVPRRGIAWVPQGRRLFPFLTVEENLRMGLLVRGADQGTLASVLELFPMLGERLRQRAATLSGGQQQMLAMARALCARPTVLLLDEPNEGLMPTLVRRVLQSVRELAGRGVGVLLVEQKVEAALEVADRVVLLEHGTVRHESSAAELRARPDVLLRYVGVRRR